MAEIFFFLNHTTCRWQVHPLDTSEHCHLAATVNYSPASGSYTPNSEPTAAFGICNLCRETSPHLPTLLKNPR